ncbi:response regulator [Paenibacillus pasadenensis]|uniref:response regulator n=1 Tax=Paenibacillus pasadenensis TaxID=217090 RepID=UPI0020426D18|nr:response regulator [Paenibacillus pasadenensis]MCM3749896.1 response regulator [Paenibacillus pasadenensis]
MYRVLLADDEADVREGLLTEIDWEACGFSVAGTAENGLEALELAERLLPDVVLTDIRMPFIDGLELVKRLQTELPLARTVILTGYDEFDYARQAVSLNVDEYLLKPFTAASLTELLIGLKEKMDRERAEREDAHKLREHYRLSQPQLQAQFLSSLLYRQYDKDQIRSRADQYGLSLDGEGCSVSVVRLDSPDGELAQGAERTDEAASSGSLSRSSDVELRLFAVFNVAEEIWANRKERLAFLHQDNIVLMDFGVGEDGWRERCQATLEHLARSVGFYLRMDVTIGTGLPKANLSGIKEAYEEALLALDYRLVPGMDRLIFLQDLERRQSAPLRFDELKEQSLSRCLKVGTAEELSELLGTIFGEIGEGHSYSAIQLYLMEVLTSVCRTAQSAEVELEELLGTGAGPYAELARQNGFAEARRWLEKLCSDLMTRIAGTRQHAYKDLVEEAIRFTRSRLHDPDLSIPVVCSHLHISTGYFCSLFKREVKLTFLQYVMQLRMELAQELLRTTELKAFEIAERIGFSEPNYFSFCFKKHTGATPKEYRSRWKEAEAGAQP